jgi:prepilin-type N-terminal cleavage/methylation domain-containing protein
MKKRRGISLIEVMVAVTLLGLMATVHTVVTMRYALRMRVAAIGVDRASAISTAVDLYSTMPFANLTSSTGCSTVTDLAAYPHQRCVTISNPTQAIRRIEIIIIPTNTAFRSDTVRVDRSLPPTGSLFS